MKYIILPILALLPFVAFSADESALEQRIKLLEQRLVKQSEQIQSLTQQLENHGEAIAKNESIAEQFGQLEPAGGGALPQITFKPGPTFESADGSTYFRVGGTLHLDSAFFNDDQADYQDDINFRRARIDLRGGYDDVWSYRLETDFAFDNARIVKAYVGYSPWESTALTLGQQKALLSQDRVASSSAITFIERGAVAETLAGGERLGLKLTHWGDDYHVGAGVFGEATGTANTGDEGTLVGLRGTYLPINDDGTLVHLGLGLQNVTDADGAITVSSRPESRMSIGTRAVSTTNQITNVDDVFTTGLELAGKTGPFFFQSEYLQTDVQRNNGNADVDLSGWYGQASWFITGENRPYSTKSGTFGKVKPTDPFEPKGDGWGAWEVAARYSSLDLNDGAITGGEMNNFTVGVNWYLNNYLRLSANYIKVDTDANAVQANDEPDIFTIRTQLSF